MEIGIARQSRQQIQIQWWQRRYSDNSDPLRQARLIESAVGQRLAKLLLHPYPMRFTAS